MFVYARQFLIGLTLGIAVLVSQGTPIQAQDLDALRASGAVGERFDGLAVARDGSAKAFVDQVNAKRSQIYQKDAASQGVPVDQVGRVYAQKILQSAPRGTWFLNPDGKWVQK